MLEAIKWLRGPKVVLGKGFQLGLLPELADGIALAVDEIKSQQ